MSPLIVLWRDITCSLDFSCCTCCTCAR